jgi:hypothetical protein
MNEIPEARTDRRWRAFALVLGMLMIPVAVVSAMLWVSGDDKSDDPGESVALQAGDAAPAFSLPGADGRLYTLDDLTAQKKVLLYFSMGPG